LSRCQNKLQHLPQETPFQASLIFASKARSAGGGLLGLALPQHTEITYQKNLPNTLAYCASASEKKEKVLITSILVLGHHPGRLSGSVNWRKPPKLWRPGTKAVPPCQWHCRKEAKIVCPCQGFSA